MEPGPLLYALSIIEGGPYGTDPYPTLVDKACNVAFTIARRHVFWDGNKRTGLLTLLEFLEANGFTVDATNDDLVEVFLRVADEKNRMELDEFTEWVRSRLALLDD